MYLQNIRTIVSGYVCVVVEGYYIEKFINICRNNNICLEKLKRSGSTVIRANVSVNDFKSVAKIAKKTKCKIKIEKKKGMPFFINKYRKRKIFAIALLIVIISIVVLSKFIWNIEVTGNENISKEEILEIAKSQGLDIGKYKGKIDAKEIVEKIRLERADISWAGIKVTGTNVVIEIVEADKKPEIIDENEFCNIVAKKDAMITSANAQNGTLQVKEGDVIKAGSILVAGWLEGKYTGTRYVHANGKVIGKVWYSEKEQIYYKQKNRANTGNMEKKYSICINNFAINLYKKLSKFEIYDTICEEKKLKISSNFYLPFKVIVKQNNEIMEEEKVYSKEEAIKIGTDNAKERLNSKIKESNGDIVNEYVNTNESEDYIEIEVIYEVLENIGTEEKIAL